MCKPTHLHQPDPDATSSAAPASRLDRILAPLADLGDAIRDEVAVSLVPVIVELDMARAQTIGLEARVSLLEARLAAAASALLGLPIAESPSGADGVVACGSTENQASATARAHDDQGDGDQLPRSAAASTVPATAPKRSRRRATPRCAICAHAPTLPGADGPAGAAAVVTEPATVLSVPPDIGEAATLDIAAHVSGRARSAVADEAGLPEAVAAEAAASPELRIMGVPAPVAPAHGSGGKAPAAAASAPEAARTTNREPGPSDPLDRARGIIHPVLEKGALELVRAGYYRDLTGLFEEAVYRLLETDHPGDLETLERGTSPQRCEDPPPI